MRYIFLAGLMACLFLFQSAAAQTGFALRKYEVIKDISYVSSAVSDAQKLDIYLPSKALASQKPFPVHIYVHGGAWVLGDKRLARPKDIRAYTTEGIILVSINYRLGDEGQYPNNVRDIQAASRWVARNISSYGGDPSNMVISGHSAGAHLIALAEIDAKNTRVKFGGYPNFKSVFPIDTASFNLTQEAESKFGAIIDNQKTKVFGTSKTELIKASLIYQIKPAVTYAPFHIFVTDERPVAARQSQVFSSALSAQGTPSKATRITDGASHADMQDKIFESGSLIHRDIVSALGR